MAPCDVCPATFVVKHDGVYSTPDALVVVRTTWRIKNPSQLGGRVAGVMGTGGRDSSTRERVVESNSGVRATTRHS